MNATRLTALELHPRIQIRSRPASYRTVTTVLPLILLLSASGLGLLARSVRSESPRSNGSEAPSFRPRPSGPITSGAQTTSGATSAPEVARSPGEEEPLPAVSSQEALDRTLAQLLSTVEEMEPAAFRSGALHSTLGERIGTAVYRTAQHNIPATLAQLRSIVRTLDGCERRGLPDANDWIVDCSDQRAAHRLAVEALSRAQLLQNPT